MTKQYTQRIIFSLFLIAGLSVFSNSQEIAYPYEPNSPNLLSAPPIFTRMTDLGFDIIQDFDETQLDSNGPFRLIVDHFSTETLVLAYSDTIILSDYLDESIDRVYTCVMEEYEGNIEFYGQAITSTVGDPLLVYRMICDNNYDVIQFDLATTDYFSNTISFDFEIIGTCVLDDDSYVIECYPTYTLRMSSEWSFLNSTTYTYYPHTEYSGLGRIMHGFGSNAIICDRDSCVILDSNLAIVGHSDFNTLYEFGEPGPKSFFANSSVLVNDSVFLIQASAYNNEFNYVDNMIWKLSSSGEALDSTTIIKLGTDEWHTRNMLRKDGE